MILKYKFLGYDEGKQTLGTYDTTNPDWGWTLNIDDYPLARDLQHIGTNLALVGFDRGYFELDSKSGQIHKVVDRWKDVSSCRRMENGNTLVTGLDLEEKGINVLTLNPRDELVNVATREGVYVRMMRPTDSGTFLIGSDSHFLETNSELIEIQKLSHDKFLHAWLAHRYKDGSTIVSAGYGAFMAKFDKAGQLLETFGGHNEVPEEIAPFFYAAFEILPDGGVLVANWQGHGRDNGTKGKQLVEFDINGKYRGSWSNPERISSLQGLLLL
ncbi:hypothetical protein [Spirochaeta cellobiosiphila]|uniref:hypothetical protein n=1 Tax=Spirochaeta cellobiosiphila TaxID=504483 RepID=UPI00040D7055|nr:hypothetical protein [Spirochaeta cellobiosiphila]